MRNYRLFFKLMIYISSMVMASCSPFQDQSNESSIVELEFDDSTTQQYTQEPHQVAVGNMTLEIQEDTQSNKKTLFLRASFFLPESKNPLFPDLSTELLKKTIYEPLPEDQPCGIPGFPDCPKLVIKNQYKSEN